VRKHLEFLDAPADVVAFRLKNYAGRDEWRNIIVVLNNGRQPQNICVPEGCYTVVCDNGNIELKEQGLGTITGKNVVVSPQSALIIHD
jgi:pullulanase